MKKITQLPLKNSPVYKGPIHEQDDAESEQTSPDSQGLTPKELAEQILAKRGEPIPSLQRDQLPEETIERHARGLIENEGYLRGKTKTERRTAASHLLKKEGLLLGRERWAIEDRAEELYQVEVVPKQEKEIIEKIKVYRKTAPKPTMTGAARLLKMDVRRLGWFWEQADD